MTVEDNADNAMMMYARALAAEVEAGLTAEEDEELEDRVRAGTAEVSLLDRVRACVWVSLRIARGPCVTGRVSGVGVDALLLDVPSAGTAAEGEWIIAAQGMTEVVGLSGRAEPARGASSRLGLASWVRAWARERSAVRLYRLHDVPVDGTIDRVGADHLDIAVHDLGLPRREDNVHRVACIPFAALSGMHRR